MEATLEHEDEQCDETRDDAVHREGRQLVRLEVAHQELDCEPRGDAGAESSDEGLSADAVAVVADRSGSLRRAAAPMMGVARRNA